MLEGVVKGDGLWLYCRERIEAKRSEPAFEALAPPATSAILESSAASVTLALFATFAAGESKLIPCAVTLAPHATSTTVAPFATLAPS